MSDNELSDIRHSFRVSQSQMAELMGVPMRTYQDLESGISKIRPVHIKAAEYAGLLLSVTNGYPIAAPAKIADLARSFVNMDSSPVRVFYGDSKEKRFDSYVDAQEFAGRIDGTEPVKYALFENTGQTISGHEITIRFMLS